MQKLFKILIFSVLVSVFAYNLVDAYFLLEKDFFYFQKDGQPISDQVEIKLECFKEQGGTKTKLKHFEATCQEYGCSFDTTGLFQLNYSSDLYRRCSLILTINQEEYSIYNILLNNPYDNRCFHQNWHTGISRKFYTYTPEYLACIEEHKKEFYPDATENNRGEFFCKKYIEGDYLIKTDLSTEKNGPCCQSGYVIKNNICYKYPKIWDQCVLRSDIKIRECKKLLKDVTDKIQVSEYGEPYRGCRIFVDISKPGKKINLDQIDKQREQDIFQNSVMSKDTAIEVNIEEVETTTQATKEVTTTKQESKTQPSTVQTETIDKIPNKPSGIKQLFSKFVNFIKLLFNN